MGPQAEESKPPCNRAIPDGADWSRSGKMCVVECESAERYRVVASGFTRRVARRFMTPCGHSPHRAKGGWRRTLCGTLSIGCRHSSTTERESPFGRTLSRYRPGEGMADNERPDSIDTGYSRSGRSRL